MTVLASTGTAPGLPAALEPTPPEVKRYQRQKLLLQVVKLLVSLAVLAVLAFVVGPRLGAWLPIWLAGVPWLRLVATAALAAVVLELPVLPLDFWSGFVLEHRFGLSNETAPAWWWRKLKMYVLAGVIGLPLLLGLYGLLWLTGAWWWVWAAAGWLGVTLLLGQLLPVVIVPLFYTVSRLQDPDLEGRLERLAEGTGLTIEGTYRLHLSEQTRKANAALAGLGRTRRVLLGDTLLENFTPEEIEVIFAHEVGHHVYRHLPKLIVWSVASAVAGFWLVDVVLRMAAERLGYTAFDDPTALPLLMLILSLFGLVLSPAQNALSRFFERQCDRYALRRTGLRDAYRSAFIKLARLNKSDADPHPLTAWLFYDHPPIRQRLALADCQ